MPTYEYACKQCGEHLEVVQSFRDEPLTSCPTCGGQLRKVFGAIGIAFKGSGFYRTDSRDTGTKTKREAKDSTSTPSSSSSTSPTPSTSSGGGASSGDSKAAAST